MGRRKKESDGVWVGMDWIMCDCEEKRREKRESSFPTFIKYCPHSLCLSVALSLCVCVSLCGANNIICLLCL